MRENFSFIAYGITMLGLLLVIMTQKLQPFRSRNIWVTYTSALLPLLVVRLIINQTLDDPSIITQTVALTCLGYAQIGYITQVFDYKNKIKREKQLSPILHALTNGNNINFQHVRNVDDSNFFSTCMAAALTAVCYICTGRVAIALFTDINIFSSNASNIAKGYLEIWEIGITLWTIILASQIIVGLYYRNTLKESNFMTEYCLLVAGNTLVYISIIALLVYGKTISIDNHTDLSINDLSCLLIVGLIVMENLIVCWLPALYAIFKYKLNSIVDQPIRNHATNSVKARLAEELNDQASNEFDSDAIILWRSLQSLCKYNNLSVGNQDSQRLSRFIYDKYVTNQWNTIVNYDIKREFNGVKSPNDLLDAARLNSLCAVVKERIVLPMYARMRRNQ